MELKKHLDLRRVFVGLYALGFLIYVLFGLQPAEASSYEVTSKLLIPDIDLVADVTSLDLENGELKTPDEIVGSYTKSINKTLMVGHSSTVFEDLAEVQNGDDIFYGRDTYKIVDVQIVEKSTINMHRLMAGTRQKTLVLMTCAGEELGAGDATHRLIVTAYAVR